jgi:hypothetical protein
MKKILLGMPLLALLVVVFMSAFTQTETTTSDLVWFQYNPTAQILVDETNGFLGDIPPSELDCPGDGEICSMAFSISQDEVELVGSSYQLKQGVNIHADNDQVRRYP